MSEADFIERSATFEGVPIKYWETRRTGNHPPLLMLHGSGPGAATHGNWRLVLGPLSECFHVIAGDLIGFGLSGRKRTEPFFDFAQWQRQSNFLLDCFHIDSINVLAHSLSGALALKLAASNSKVRRVLTTGTLGAPFQANPDLDLTWTFPETEADLIRAGRMLVYNPSLIDDAYLEGRKKILYDGEYKKYFQCMFAGSKQPFIDAAVLTMREMQSIKCPVLLVHGRDDRPTPHGVSQALAKGIAQADYVQLAQCGHSVALEHPHKLVDLAKSFFL